MTTTNSLPPSSLATMFGQKFGQRKAGEQLMATAPANDTFVRQPRFGGDHLSVQPTIIPLPYQPGEEGASRHKMQPTAFVMPTIVEENDGRPYAIDLVSWAFNAGNTLYFYTDFNDDSAQTFTSALQYKKHEILQERMKKRGMTPEEARNLKPGDEKFDPEKDIITIDINSPGGVITSLYNMIDTMDSLKKNGIIIQTVAHGLAASCGSLLVALGSPGYRKMTPNSCVMIHQPLGGAGGQATDIEIQNEVIQEMKRKLTWMLYESSTTSDLADIPEDQREAYKAFVTDSDNNRDKKLQKTYQTFLEKKGRDVGVDEDAARDFRPDSNKKTFQDFVNAMERDNFLFTKGSIEEFGLIDEIVDT